MRTEYLLSIKDISTRALADMNYGTMCDDELTSLCNLQVAVYFEVLMNTDMDEFAPLLDLRLRAMCDEVTRRVGEVSDIERCVVFSRALHELSRTGRFVLQDFIGVLDRRIVRHVMHTASADWPLRHAALAVLMDKPLTDLRFVRGGERRRVFTIGREYFEDTLRLWADTIDINGAWHDIGPAEAMSRIVLLARDFGSVEGVDNRDVMERAYKRYWGYSSRNVQELETQFRACIWQWRKRYDSNDIGRILLLAEGMLHDSGSTSADRWALDSILLRGTDLLLSLGEQSVA